MKFTLLLLVLAVSISTSQSNDEASSAFPDGVLVDMSYPFNEQTIYWPTAPGFSKSTDFEGQTDNGYYYSAYSISTAEHGGTHLDAPIHFAEGKHSTDQIPLEQLMGLAVVIDVQEQAAADRDYLITTEDIAKWESTNGSIPTGAIVLFRTGFGKYWPDREAYMGTAERGPDAVTLLHFPGIDPAAADFLAGQRSIKAVGIDTPSIDYGQSTLFESHQHLFKANIPAFENIANLDKLPAKGAWVIALPMKIEGGSGGPLRMVGIVPRP
jgi:kynurenine formamidase